MSASPDPVPVADLVFVGFNSRAAALHRESGEIVWKWKSPQGSGAVALMPVYARDILDLGPWGLGLLRAAPGIGAIVMALWLAGQPIRDHAGLIMLFFVGMFGFFTIVFGASTIVWLSVVALALLGAADMVSVYIRETLIQLWTPDRLRGRVNAVNMVFVGASNELGEFRAGSMAAWIGTVPAVVFGGVGAIAVAGLWNDLKRATHPQEALVTGAGIEVPVSPDGHFYLTAMVNGVKVRFVVDTGASDVVLTQRDAARIGLDPKTLNYFGTATTANGQVMTAPVRLDTLSLGDRVDRDVPAVVNNGVLDTSLLGMSYLGRYQIALTRDQMVLKR